MPIYLKSEDSFLKTSKIYLPTERIPGTDHQPYKKICKIYICTNTDPLQFELVYNGNCACGCLCEWCTSPDIGFEIQCQYHSKQILPSDEGYAGFNGCGCDPDAPFYPAELLPFQPGCYYILSDTCPPGPTSSKCFAKCCESLNSSSCDPYSSLSHLESCCALRNDPFNEGSKCVDNATLYAKCDGESYPPC